MSPAAQPQTAISWSAPSRPFKQRTKDTHVTIISVAALFGLVLFIIEGILPVLLLVSMVFLFYVLSTVKPTEIDYDITDAGILIAGKATPWDTTIRFWFTERSGSSLLIIETLNFPGRLELIIKPELKGKIKTALMAYIPHEQGQPSFYDKAATFTNKIIPLD